MVGSMRREVERAKITVKIFTFINSRQKVGEMSCIYPFTLFSFSSLIPTFSFLISDCRQTSIFRNNQKTCFISVRVFNGF